MLNPLPSSSVAHAVGRRPLSTPHDFMDSRYERVAISHPAWPQGTCLVVTLGQSAPIQEAIYPQPPASGKVLDPQQFGITEAELLTHNCYTFAFLPWVPGLTTRDWLTWSTPVTNNSDSITTILSVLFSCQGVVKETPDFERLGARNGDVVEFIRAQGPRPRKSASHAARVMHNETGWWIIEKRAKGPIHQSQFEDVCADYTAVEALLYRAKTF